MSGGKGGSTSSQVQIPKFAEDAAKQNIAMGQYASQLGYMPYYGLDVAAQTPMTQMANQATYGAAQEFGLAPAGMDINAGMGNTRTINGITGYSGGDLFDQAVAELQARRPAQAQAYQDMFIDPFTGERRVIFSPEGAVADPNAGAGTIGATVGSGGSVLPKSASSGSSGGSLQEFEKNYGWVDPYSVGGLATSMFPAGSLLLRANNANAVGRMQDVAGIDRSGFFDRAFLDPRESIGTKTINDYEYLVNMGGGVHEGRTGLTPYEAQKRRMSNYDISQAPAQGMPSSSPAPTPAQPTTITGGFTPNNQGGGGGYTGTGTVTTTQPVRPTPVAVAPAPVNTPSGRVDPTYNKTSTGSTASSNGTTATYTSGGGGLTLSGKNPDGTYTVPDAYVSRPSSSSSSSSSGGGGCFITTATLKATGQDDDGVILNAFRKFRDDYMGGKEGEAKEYYEVAPKIVEAIGDNDDEYARIWDEYLVDAYDSILRKDYDGAYIIYKDMFNRLKEKWGA